ncbi:hypothetical protein DGMP_06390 [Desulfomarina profundi]|uniref:Uncharacterized protein n=1 Tax=Desulfomarina profundi TaxID=2772557 RepID=A0A8D5JQF0_9BACT|nr:hypothetical protein DGMP_06390 [Desulfomarina profundi]
MKRKTNHYKLEAIVDIAKLIGKQCSYRRIYQNERTVSVIRSIETVVEVISSKATPVEHKILCMKNGDKVALQSVWFDSSIDCFSS